jgi:hypothetical protein
MPGVPATKCLKYLDVGAQELYRGEAAEFEAFFAWALRERGLAPVSRERCLDLARRSDHRWNPVNKRELRATVAELFDIVGCEYQSIDVLGVT